MWICIRREFWTTAIICVLILLPDCSPERFLLIFNTVTLTAPLLFSRTRFVLHACRVVFRLERGRPPKAVYDLNYFIIRKEIYCKAAWRVFPCITTHENATRVPLILLPALVKRHLKVVSNETNIYAITHEYKIF